MTPASSLQRAATAAASGCSITTIQKKGSFEACFADGLDLSEFGVPASSSLARQNHHPASTAAPCSHAAALLRKKQAEGIEKQKHALQEARLLDAVRKRQRRNEDNDTNDGSTSATASSRSLTATTTAAAAALAGPSSRTLISSLVVGMHSAEKSDEPRHKMLRGRSAASKRLRRNSAMTTSVKGKSSMLQAGKRKQQQAVRKVRRSKY